MQHYTISVEVPPTEEDAQAVRRGLIEYNLSRAAIDGSEGLAVLVRDARGEIVGGAVGKIWGEVLEVRYLWMHEALRGQGFGTRALDQLEALARERGCQVATLDTFSFQAPDFYRKQGYEPFGVIEGYPEGHQKWFFRKRLS